MSLQCSNKSIGLPVTCNEIHPITTIKEIRLKHIGCNEFGFYGIDENNERIEIIIINE